MFANILTLGLDYVKTELLLKGNSNSDLNTSMKTFEIVHLYIKSTGRL